MKYILLLAAQLLFALHAATVFAQQPPYDVFPPAEPPYYRVRYEAAAMPNELVYAVNYTLWIPKDVKSIRGVIVHQHGCGEGSCKSGLTGAYDLHWQALAKKHDCALLAPSYEQPDKADCQMWCDPRNGSDAAFQKCLVDLGAKSGHPELSKAPWALWGHSGGGHWAGGMVLLHPERVAAAWLRSGVPLLKPDPARTTIKAHRLPDAALKAPVMCNPGTKEGVTVKDGRFAGVWPANEAFFKEVRSRGGLIGVAVDPLTAHECGNQRYFAIPWLDACLSIRLPKSAGDPLHDMPTDKAWLAPVTGTEAVPAGTFTGDPLQAAWLPNEAVARAWMQYVKDTAVADSTPPPAPTNLRVSGNNLTWEAEADLESGLAGFIIERDGEFLANVPEQGKNPFGRPVFQNLQYSDTPTQPLVPLQFTDTKAVSGKKHRYRVVSVNTAGLKSQPSASSVARGDVDKPTPAFNDPRPQRHELTARASEIDPRTRPHPEIDFVFDKQGQPSDIEHAVVDTRIKPQGRLVIWLMGYSPPLFERLSGYGLHAIQVHYANGWFGKLSPRAPPSDDKFLGKIRLEAATGQDFSDAVNIPQPDGMMERALQFVKWLAQENPHGGWAHYLTDDQRGLRWDRVIMAGSSHGSTTAARFAIHQRVDRVVMFCGPRDQLETWQSLPSATPSNRFFGFSHVLDGGWTNDHYCRSWELLGLHQYGPIVNVDQTQPPYGNSRRLITAADVKNDARRAHSSVVPGGAAVKDASGQLIHEAVWRYLFTQPVDVAGEPGAPDPGCLKDQRPTDLKSKSAN